MLAFRVVFEGRDRSDSGGIDIEVENDRLATLLKAVAAFRATSAGAAIRGMEIQDWRQVG